MKKTIFFVGVLFLFSNVGLANDAERFFGQLLNAALNGDQDQATSNTSYAIQSRHGGQVVRANSNYYFETTLSQSGMFKLYVYDRSGKQLNVQGVSASWAISPQSRYALQGAFEQDLNGEYFWVKLPRHDSKMLHISVGIEAGGNIVSTEQYVQVIERS